MKHLITPPDWSRLSIVSTGRDYEKERGRKKHKMKHETKQKMKQQPKKEKRLYSKIDV